MNQWREGRDGKFHGREKRSTVCPGRLEGDTFEEKGPSIKEEGGRVFPPTTGWGRQWVKEKQ